MRKMKDSGVAWIGNIPSTWKVVKLKNVGTIQTGATPTKTEQSLYYSSESGVPWIKAENLGTFNPIIRANEYLTDEGCKQGRVFPPNTVYICCIASVGKVGYSTISCSCNQQINGIVFNGNMFWKYGFYMSIAQETLYSVYASGNVMKIINSERQANLLCPFPEYAEQQKIAAHLDRKCTQIDALIANAEQQIEKLKVYKQSVITETVTKGLDPDVEMKDSGVEWIGEIPENWEVIRLKNLATIVRGGSPRPAGDERFYVGSIPFMKIADITKDENKYVYDCVSSIKEAGLVHTRMVEPETLLLTNSGATLGVPKITMFRTTFNDGIAAFLNLDKKIDILYAFYSLKARTKLFLESASMGMGQPNLNTEIIGNTLITLPSIEEQNEIVAYLDEKCSQIDKLIALKQQKIEKLQQYKKSLIYEYVTGKKEV